MFWLNLIVRLNNIWIAIMNRLIRCYFNSLFMTILNISNLIILLFFKPINRLFPLQLFIRIDLSEFQRLILHFVCFFHICEIFLKIVLINSCKVYLNILLRWVVTNALLQSLLLHRFLHLYKVVWYLNWYIFYFLWFIFILVWWYLLMWLYFWNDNLFGYFRSFMRFIRFWWLINVFGGIFGGLFL